MNTIYYALQNVVNGKGNNVTKVLSLALGLTIGILLFSQNTYLPKADIIISIQTLYNMIGQPRWWSNQFYKTIVRMRDSNNLEYIDNRLQSMVEKYVSFNLEKTGQYCEYGVIPFTKARFENPSTSNRLIIFGALGFSIVFVSLMNYILTAIANLSRRAKMARVHKCCGAEAENILSMFLIETLLIILISLLIAAFLILNCADLIKEILSTSLTGLFTWHTLWVPLVCICIVLLVGGCIPRYIYAKIPATQAFRHYTDGKKGWKRSLLFVQFTGVSFILGLLIVTLLQYHHLMTQPLGYNPDGLVTAQIIVNEGTLDVKPIDLSNVENMLKSMGL